MFVVVSFSLVFVRSIVALLSLYFHIFVHMVLAVVSLFS